MIEWILLLKQVSLKIFLNISSIPVYSCAIPLLSIVGCYIIHYGMSSTNPFTMLLQLFLLKRSHMIILSLYVCLIQTNGLTQKVLDPGCL